MPSSDTAWKILEAKVSQLKESVAAARLPFLLALTWSLIWASALYSHDFGYTTKLLERYQSALLNPSSCTCSDRDTIYRYHAALHHEQNCDQKTNALNSQSTQSAESSRIQKAHELCTEVLKEQHKKLLGQQVESWSFRVPWTGIQTTVFDLGVVGNAITFLLIAWLYYASRRENHAIRSFINTSSAEEDLGVPYFRTFVLYPMDDTLNVNHYAFAHQAVAQRFIFLTSRRNLMLLAATLVLLLLPLAVSVWNFLTDIRDILRYGLMGTVGFRFVCSLAIEGIIAWVSGKIVLRQLTTNALLNAWYLASRYVWEGANPDTKATPVLIDPMQQVAKPHDHAQGNTASPPAPAV